MFTIFISTSLISAIILAILTILMTINFVKTPDKHKESTSIEDNDIKIVTYSEPVYNLLKVPIDHSTHLYLRSNNYGTLSTVIIIAITCFCSVVNFGLSYYMLIAKHNMKYLIVYFIISILIVYYYIALISKHLYLNNSRFPVHFSLWVKVIASIISAIIYTSPCWYYMFNLPYKNYISLYLMSILAIIAAIEMLPKALKIDDTLGIWLLKIISYMPIIEFIAHPNNEFWLLIAIILNTILAITLIVSPIYNYIKARRGLFKM